MQHIKLAGEQSYQKSSIYPSKGGGVGRKFLDLEFDPPPPQKKHLPFMGLELVMAICMNL